MGYGTRANGTIKTFTPDNDENTIYLSASILDYTLQEIIELIQEKWPDCSFDDITIEAEHIHTDCLGYDLYDSGDYTDYIIIRRNNNAD